MSAKGFQIYGFDAWDESGRFYFSAFGARHAPRTARLVAVDPAQLPFQRPAPARPAAPWPASCAASPDRPWHDARGPLPPAHAWCTVAYTWPMAGRARSRALRTERGR